MTGEARTPTTTARQATTVIGAASATDLSDERTGGELTLEEMQRVRAMCAAVIETVDGARLLLEETHRDGVTLSNMVGSLQRRMVRRLPPDRQRRGGSARSSPGEAEATTPWAGLDPLAREQARLEGALLASRTAAHLVGNDRTTTIGLNELVRHRLQSGKSVDPKLLDDAIASAKRAAHHLQELQEIAQLELDNGSSATLAVLDLALSGRKA